MINYSIIIPHKNTPELLQRCLDSIPERDDVQIIVVDDNSDPGKVDFTKFPGLGNGKTEVFFTKEGRGAGYARNTGLKKAAGKWILFSDADDYFIEGFLRHLDKYVESDYDVIYFGIVGMENIYYSLMHDAVHNHNYEGYKFSTYAPCGKMIKHSLIKENSIVFDETLVANDRMFALKTAYAAANAFFDESEIYFRERRQGSLTSVFTREARLDRFRVYLRQNIFLEKTRLPKYKMNIFSYILKDIILYQPKLLAEILKTLKENNIGIFRNCSVFCPPILHLIRRKLKR